jgi:DNA-binding PadR family transcriptional regulator
MKNVKLTPTAYAVLGLLSFGQSLSGYEIRQWAKAALSHFYPAPAQSQIYGELTKLESLGLVIGVGVAQRDRPDKIAFSITADGIEVLDQWGAGPVHRPTIKHHVALRVFLGHRQSPDRLVPILEAHRDRLLVTLDELETHSAAMTGDPGTGYAAVVADWIGEMHRGDLRGVERTLELLARRPEQSAS